MSNPLLSRWDTPFEIAPFRSISDDDFAPALDQALTSHKAQIDAIASSSEPPGFANVIEALETPCRELEQVLGVFFTVVAPTATQSGRNCSGSFRRNLPRISRQSPPTKRCMRGSRRCGTSGMSWI